MSRRRRRGELRAAGCGLVWWCGVECRLAIYTAPLSRMDAGGTVRFGRRRPSFSLRAAAQRACQTLSARRARAARPLSMLRTDSTQPAQTLSPCPQPSSAAAAALVRTPRLADALLHCLTEPTARRTRPSTSPARGAARALRTPHAGSKREIDLSLDVARGTRSGAAS